MWRVLLVDDDDQCELLVKSALESFVELTCAKSIQEASALLEKQHFHLILLDVMLPDGDGFSYCAYLQKDRQVDKIPIIFLTNQTGTSFKIHGFTLGADDYVEKPFNILEFRARLESKLNRWYLSRANESIAASFGALRINLDAHRAYIDSQAQQMDLGLTPIEFKLLHHLFKNAGRTLSRNQLLDAVWGVNVNVTDRTIDKHVSSLRKKLGEYANYVQTSTGFGYILALPQSESVFSKAS